MHTPKSDPTADLSPSFKLYYELMSDRVSEILLVSSPYDAFIMEEDGRLAERLIHEYSGLNLTRPPRLKWVATAAEALEVLESKKIDMVLTMPRLDGMDPFVLSRTIKSIHKDIPIFLLAHSGRTATDPVYEKSDIDRTFVWSGNTDLLVSIIKNVEDRRNVRADVEKAAVRVIIMVEDTPFYYSSLLPFLYRELVCQTHNIMADSLNEEHRLVRMRTRPKILLATTYEEAWKFYEQYKSYLLCVISDVRFKKNGKVDAQAGFTFLSKVWRETPDVPCLVLSSEEENRKKAHELGGWFLNKNEPGLQNGIRLFLIKKLGFGDFIFRHKRAGKEIARVSNMWEMERVLPRIPGSSIYNHALQNDFYFWFTARFEIQLASKLRSLTAADFGENGERIRKYILEHIAEIKRRRQKGVVTDFTPNFFDPATDFIKAGKGSLGGKARGLAFVASVLHKMGGLEAEFPGIRIAIPRTMVLTTECFDSFATENGIKELALPEMSDEEIATTFLNASFPVYWENIIGQFLEKVQYPLAVRSSSLMEDAQSRPCAGIYKTYMLPNSDAGITTRINRLLNAVKLVYASIYLETSRIFSRNSMYRIEDEKMAVIIQQMTGGRYGRYFYPAISGVAQSYNFYPIGHMKADEGVASIAAGLGKIVVEGGASLRFSPKYPEIFPQFATTDDILENSQRFFYAMDLEGFPDVFGAPESPGANLEDELTLTRVDIDSDFSVIPGNSPVRFLCSSYFPADNVIRDGAASGGYPVLTFANVLKHGAFPLAEIIMKVLEICRKGMGCPVEVEFAVNLAGSNGEKPEFALLQIRPMTKTMECSMVEVTEEDVEKALCVSTKALGNGTTDDMEDLIIVEPETFDPSRTVEIAAEVGLINRKLSAAGRKYLLIGPGRWGSFDRWLGIPVAWRDIYGVGVIIETAFKNFRADPSQGSHFFHNITSLGISYLTINPDYDRNFIDWERLKTFEVKERTEFVKHLRLDGPMTVKIDGRNSHAAVLV